MGLWGDEAAAVQDAPDRGDAGDVVDVGVAVQVFGDGGRTGVVAGFARVLRNRMMRSSTSGATAWGLVWGRGSGG